jgi:heat shock protein HslJ
VAARALVLALAAILSLLSVACGEQGLIREAHPATLANTAWRAVSVAGLSPVAGSEPTAIFKVADVTGSASCNHWGANYRYEGSTGRITFDGLGMTAMGCANAALTQVETAFSNALGSVTTVSIDPAGRLVLSGPGGDIVMAVDAVGG